ncbi:MAG TPA: ELWxxDGT repeat protein [Solirubrobacterales bacterium]
MSAAVLGPGAGAAHAAGAHLVKDVRPGPDGSGPSWLVGMRGVVYFEAASSIGGDGLWRSDGTAAGTRPLGGPTHGYSLTRAGDTLFFLVDGGGRRTELWRSDGTKAGTTLVRDFQAGIRYSSPDDLTNHNGVLFFTADDGSHGDELWRSDGTREGTRLERDVDPGRASSRPRWLTSVGDKLFFTARDGEHGRELWRSDGTPGGTRLVRDLHTRGKISPAWLTSFRGGLFFASAGEGRGRELWRSDGTAAGTRLVKDINPKKGSRPVSLTPVGRTLFLTANDGEHGQELWRSDGTASGTRLVRDILKGDRPGGYFGPSRLSDVAGRLFFGADDGVHGPGLWRSDGTGAGTRLLRTVDLNGPRGPVNVGGTGFFEGNDRGEFGWELWATDGTRSGTTLFRDIYPGRRNSTVGGLAAVGGTLFFSATDGVHGDELWKATP